MPRDGHIPASASFEPPKIWGIRTIAREDVMDGDPDYDNAIEDSMNPATHVSVSTTWLQRLNLNVFSVTIKGKIFFFKRFFSSLLSPRVFGLMLGYMGYTDKLQKLCALRGLDQSALAKQVHLSKSSISRILSGTQEPKLRLAYNLAKALGVTLDYLVDDSTEVGESDQLVMVTKEEMTILTISRRLGHEAAMDRLIHHGVGSIQTVLSEPNTPHPSHGHRSKPDPTRGDR